MDPNRVLAEVVYHHREALADLERLAEDADNSNAAVGAARSRAAVAKDLFKLLADAGLLPESAGSWRFARDLRGFVQAIYIVCDRHGIPTDEVKAEFDRLVGSSEPVRVSVGIEAP